MNKKNEKKYGEHFTKFVLEGKKFDFDEFKTNEELDRFERELDEYLEEEDKGK